MQKVTTSGKRYRFDIAEDLTHPLENRMPVDPRIPLSAFERAATIAMDGANLIRTTSGSLTGSHIDTPIQLFPNGTGIDSSFMPLR